MKNALVQGLRMAGIVILCAASSLWMRQQATYRNVYQVAGSAEQAGQLQEAIRYYPRGSGRDRAARFLVRNMAYHQAYAGETLATFREAVATCRDTLDAAVPEQIDSLWQTVNRGRPAPSLVPMATLVSKEFLTHHIDQTFAQWEQVPWKDSITWPIFLNYILPFQAANEPVYNFQDSLRNYYAPLVEGIESPFEAYCAVKKDIISRFTILSRQAVPHSYKDPMVIHRLMKGTCNDRTTYIVAVMRSLCIPVAFDFCPRYANYSHNLTHSWAPYIAGRHVLYTTRNDTIRQRNFIYTDFRYEYKADTEGTPFYFDSVKTIAKVWRKTYAPASRRIPAWPGLPAELAYPLHDDVSADYGKTEQLTFEADRKSKQPVVLCTFLTGTGWIPVDVGRQHGRKIRFNHVSRDICYLPAYLEDGQADRLRAAADPVILDNQGHVQVLTPDTVHVEPVELRRKYLLISMFTGAWSRAIGSCFEASDVAGFADSSRTVLLHTITTLPIGPTRVQVDAPRPYRYVRFRSPQKHLRMAEVAFFGIDGEGNEKELKGDIIFDSIPETNAHNLFDKDYATETCVNRILPPTPYWIGYDLGPDIAHRITRIEYCTYFGGNFVEPGDLYELFYFDRQRGWVSLGQQTSTSEVLHYDNVPRNALLWLRDLTKGREERIFVYRNGKQVWW
ncbi:MAG: hypothetical protein IKI72_04240 [Bacteroidales bacterium]|nr:hypothetical protein [Bacteroidales bacterium]